MVESFEAFAVVWLKRTVDMYRWHSFNPVIENLITDRDYKNRLGADINIQRSLYCRPEWYLVVPRPPERMSRIERKFCGWIVKPLLSEQAGILLLHNSDRPPKTRLRNVLCWFFVWIVYCCTILPDTGIWAKIRGFFLFLRLRRPELRVEGGGGDRNRAFMFFFFFFFFFFF